MDQRLLKAAIMGDVVALDALLKEDPLILRKVSLSSISETPLHVASLAGHVDFVRKIMELVPLFAQERNKDGFAPIHLATAAGHLEVAKELLNRADSDLCLLKDKAGRTALHLAAIKGRVHIIDELLSNCPHQNALEQVTLLGETALHLAVKNSQFEAFNVLFETSKKLQNHKEMVDAEDKEGKTILEIANATNQLQVLYLMEEEDQKQTQDEGKAKHLCIYMKGIIKDCYMRLEVKIKKSWGMYFEDKNLLPLMASMIAAATFQTGLNPPSIIWEKGIHLDTKCISIGTIFKRNDPWAFKSCPASRFYAFMVCNTIAFASSLVLIPYSRHVVVATIMTCFCLYFMLFSYLTILDSIFPSTAFATVAVLICFALLILKPMFTLFIGNLRTKSGGDVQNEGNE